LIPNYDDLQIDKDRFYLRLPSAGLNERLFGGGEQYSYLDLNGRDWPIWVREQGFGRDPDSPLGLAIEALVPGVGN